MPETTRLVKYAGLVIKAGTIERVQIGAPRADSGAASIHELVGDTFCSCFRAPGSGRGRFLVGWCDDDFLRKAGALAWNILLPPDLYQGGYAIRGPVVITAHVGDKTVSMTELELSAFSLGPLQRVLFQGDVVAAPDLLFRPGYDA